ncbi:type II secretion system F family protein [Novosphingobium sp. G106]|uniref:type II secretion system F family protein n=1 Tax=Novosphingobium sp. G106 TaxID=2849500 RepID=UPI001C2CFF73|nr:type II secretion system F family protein [Novosphingobium sp. G106]MBV1689323.1 type II secretion system F family protein [Novosphingobium sp. G106]
MIDFLVANPYARYAALLALFAVVGGVALLVMLMTSRRVSLRGELRSLTGTQAGTPETLRSRRDDQWTRLVDRIEKAGLSLTDTKADRLRAKMLAAGFQSTAAPQIYTLLRLALVILLPSAFVGLNVLSGGQMSYIKLYIVGSITALAGLYLPAVYIAARIDRRKTAIVNGFPDSLDLMLVCVEAGLGLEAALDRVGREVAVSHPLVAEMLTIATLQLRAGASRETALRKMADSVGVDEIGSFATLLIQSDKLGTSIATTLRIYAAEMREKRRMRAEEKAHRIPVLISIPLVTCLLPVMIGILMLPAAIRVVRVVFPAMAGGG